MNKNAKTILVTSILSIPVLVFLFLKGCGVNEYKLPVYFAYDSLMQKDGTYLITDAHTIPDFFLTNHTGENVSLSNLKGHIFVADFFFTRCPTICPEMTSELVRVQEAFRNDKQVKIISFTVDPSFDTEEVLNTYSKKYNASPDKWYFITGKKDSIYTLAKKGFYVSAMEEMDAPEEFIHSEKLILVDKEGRIRGYYNGTKREDVDRLIAEIKILQHGYAKNNNSKE